MNTQLIIESINRLATLAPDETEYLESVLISRPFRSGEVIVKSGDPARYIMFMNAGYVMSYFTDNNGTDHVVQFAATGWWVGDFYALSDEKNTPYTTRALCDGEILFLPRLALQQLLESFISFERYFRITFQNSLFRHQLRYIESHSKPAEERYQAFLDKYPGIQQYVPQKYIASYLGISAEFLSKIRGKMARQS